MWYVLQTITGREETLVHMIKKAVPADLYEDCFSAYHERVWRRQGQSIVHVERLFPGYVFIIADEPDKLFLALKRVPAMSKLLSDGEYDFIPLEKAEEAFLDEMLGEDRIVKLSYVETDGKGKVQRISGPLEGYRSQVARYQFKKRYALIRFQMFGMEKTASLGIILREDVQQEILYGRVEAPVEVPASYEVERPETGTVLMPGDRVRVVSGMMEGMEGTIWRIQNRKAEVGIRLFGQDVSVEVAEDELRLEME